MVKSIKKPAPGAPKGPLDRIADLERHLLILASAYEKLAREMQEVTDAHGETFEVFGEIVGIDKIREVSEAREARRQQLRADQAKEALDKAIEAGQVTAAEVVSPNSLIVGVERDPEGKVLGTGRLQARIQKLPEPLRGEIIGKKVGDKIVSPDGELELTGIFDSVPVPPPVAPPAPQAFADAVDGALEEAPLPPAPVEG